MSVYTIGMECGMHIPLENSLPVGAPVARVQVELIIGQHAGERLSLENGAIQPLTDSDNVLLASLERQLPRRSLIWTTRGIMEVGRGWRWQASPAHPQAPWLEAVHHSWPNHAPRWLLKAPVVIVTANALPTANRTRHQRDLARLWLRADAALIYLATESRDSWQMHQHCETQQLQGATLSNVRMAALALVS
ncbi:hypothetical protein [Cobetia sp. L2A1]|uniref:hypothetical protein n=1 Tax=Cobetia sp. L2A1 TaxID=2686360 RepID=UPI00131BB257|nr:hypothetical protein [Cobetia sp. L2A1]